MDIKKKTKLQFLHFQQLFMQSNKTSPQFPGLRLSQSGVYYKNGGKLPASSIATIIKLHQEGKIPAAIVRETGFSRKTVDKYIRQHKRDSNPFLQHKKPRLSGVHTQPERIEFVIKTVGKCPGITIQGIKLRYEMIFEQSISCKMIHYILTQVLKYSRKKIIPIEWARLNAAVIALHDEFGLFFYCLFSLSF